MTKEEITQRIEQLRTAIAYSRCTNTMMNIGNGIMCNQEVAALLSVLDGIDKKPRYTIPDNIELKVNEINTIVLMTNWQKPVVEWI